MLLSAIMSTPEFGEICFLVALILFAVAAVVHFARSTVSEYSVGLVSAGLAFTALGWLAL